MSPHFINDRTSNDEPKLKLEGPDKLDLVKSFLSLWFPGRNLDQESTEFDVEKIVIENRCTTRWLQSWV